MKADIKTDRHQLEQLVLAIHDYLVPVGRHKKLEVVEVLAWGILQKLSTRSLARMKARAGKPGEFTYKLTAEEMIAVLICLPADGKLFLQLLKSNMHKALTAFGSVINLNNIH
jgi:hypothetical protein